MRLLDDEGTLLGAVNVVDALVLLLLLGAVVAVAGLASDDDGATDEQLTRHLTVTLSDQPESVVEGVTPGPVTLRGTDGRIRAVAHGSVGETASTVVWASVTIPRPAPESVGDATAVLGRQRVRPGTRLVVATDRFEAVGTVTAIAPTPPAVERTNASVVVNATVPSEVARAAAVGDRQRVGDTTVAALREIATAPAGPGETRLRVTLSMRAWRDEAGRLRHGADRLRPGRRFTFGTDTYQFRGTVVEGDR